MIATETIVRPATVADLKAIEALRRADGDCLGFIPKALFESICERKFYEGANYHAWKIARLVVAEDAGEVTGYVYAALTAGSVKLHQVCVRHDARRLERGLALVHEIEAEAVPRGAPFAKCRVAFDIEANHFWQAAGFVAVSSTVSTWLNQRESKSKRPLIIYEKPLCQSLLFGPEEA